MADHDLTDRTVLITGGAGFIGSHLADALVAENTVRVLDDLSSGRRDHVPAGATVIEGDVRNSETVDEAMADVDVAFHQAALVSVEDSVERPRRSHDVIANGTLNVLEAARREDARAVVASSSAIYGHPESVPVAESEPKTPTSPYGAAKLTVDSYARLYHDLYDLETVALRYFNVYGPRQSPEYSAVISVFFEQARRGDPITVEGDGSQTRDFVHVRDVVQANLRAATTDRVGTAFNVGTGTSVTVAELAESVQEIVDSPSDIAHTAPRSGDIQHSRADIARARRHLNYEPTVSLDDGLATLLRDSTA